MSGLHRKPTQVERVLKHMQDFGSITSFESYSEYGITQLAARIVEIKRLGYEIETKRITRKNRYGERVYFVAY